MLVQLCHSSFGHFYPLYFPTINMHSFHETDLTVSQFSFYFVILSLKWHVDFYFCPFLLFSSVITFFSPLLFPLSPSSHIFSFWSCILCFSFLLALLSASHSQHYLLSSSFNICGIHCLPISSWRFSGSIFLSQPLSIHPWIPCLPRHFCLFLCICLTSYSLLMYLSHV